MDSGTAGVDDVEVVGSEVCCSDSECARGIVVTGLVSSLALSDGYLIVGVVLVIGCVSIDGELPSESRDCNLLIVSSWLNEDNASSGRCCRY